MNSTNMLLYKPPSGIRDPKMLMEGQTTAPRQHIMQAHGMRKFFETNAINAGMSPLFVRRLLGQKSGLEDAYFRPSDSDILEGNNRHIGYVGIIDFLTIDESNKLKREVEEYRVKASQYDSLRAEIDQIKPLIGSSK